MTLEVNHDHHRFVSLVLALLRRWWNGPVARYARGRDDYRVKVVFFWWVLFLQLKDVRKRQKHMFSNFTSRCFYAEKIWTDVFWKVGLALVAYVTAHRYYDMQYFDVFRASPPIKSWFIAKRLWQKLEVYLTDLLDIFYLLVFQGKKKQLLQFDTNPTDAVFMADASCKKLEERI